MGATRGSFPAFVWGTVSPLSNDILRFAAACVNRSEVLGHASQRPAIWNGKARGASARCLRSHLLLKVSVPKYDSGA
jgi:hypothetical protein